MSDEADNKKEPDADEATARAAKRRRAARKRRAAGKRADNDGTAATSAKRKRRKRARLPQAAPEDEARLAKLMVAAAATLILGLAIVGTGASDIGGPLTIVGLLALVASIHFYGRLGAGGYRRHNGEAPLSQR